MDTRVIRREIANHLDELARSILPMVEKYKLYRNTVNLEHLRRCMEDIFFYSIVFRDGHETSRTQNEAFERALYLFNLYANV